MSGAGDRNRTRDLLITNQLLYLLSYASVHLRQDCNFDEVCILGVQPAEGNSAPEKMVYQFEKPERMIIELYPSIPWQNVFTTLPGKASID